MDDTNIDRRRCVSRVTTGLILIVVGSAMLLDRTGFADVRFTAHLWPFVVLVIGASRFLVPLDGQRSGGPRWGGGWLLIVGVWGLISEFHLFDLDYGTSWPLLVVGSGIMLVLRAILPHETEGPRRVEGR
jgi:hypothetical protein